MEHFATGTIAKPMAKIKLLTFDAHAGKDDKLAGGDQIISFARLRRRSQVELENSTHWLFPVLKPIHSKYPALGRVLWPSIGEF